MNSNSASISPSLRYALVVIDEEPLRDRCLLEIRALEDERRRMAEKIEHYEKVDKLAFQQWLQLTFRKDIRRVEKLRDEALDLESLIDDVRAESAYTGRNESLCYRRVKARRERGEEAPWKKGKEGLFQKEEFEEFFSNTFRAEGMTDEDAERLFENFKTASGIPPPNGKVEVPLDLKELYRWLAKRLHPDSNQVISNKGRTLWLEVQSAYDDRDLGRLRALKARVEMLQNEAGEEVQSIWGLKSLIKKIRAALGPLKKEYRRCRGEMAWNFSKAPDHSREHRIMSKEFKHSLRELQTHLEMLRYQIRIWED